MTVTAITVSNDTCIDDGHVNTNYGSVAEMRVQNTGTGKADEWRILVSHLIDVAGLTAGSQVTAATFACYGYSGGDPASLYVAFHRCRREIENFGEDYITWTNWETDTPSAWGTPGAKNTTTDIDNGVTSDTITMPGVGWGTWNVLTLVQDAIDNQSGDLRMVTYSYTSLDQSWQNFYTTEWSGVKPTLTITWTPPAGGDILKISGVAWANVKKVSGVAEASISKVSGVSAN